ncbi:hypothetical protein JW948_10825 [bacterium]|nr:hypothetical protein [bacterium]
MKMRRERIVRFLKKQEGVSLIEAIILIVVLAVSLPPISELLQESLFSSVRMSALNKASFYAQQRLEQIVADYANTVSTSGGYENIVQGYYEDEVPEAGFNTHVDIVTSVYNGINYKEIEITCSNPQSDQVVRLKTWIVDLDA